MKKDIPNNNAYKKIASYYDEATNLKVFNTYILIIGEVKNKFILDLGCGTGTLLNHYSSNNKTFGIDGSLEMIKKAKAKDKRSKYKVADIRTFKINQKFDIISCVYDTVNHFSSLSEWRQLFKSVASHLKPNAFFVFDYNTLKGLKNSVGTVLQKIGKDYVVRQVKFDGRLCKWIYRIFARRPSGIFKYQKLVIYEKSFPIKAIEKEVRKYFKIINTIKSDANRVYVKVKKKTIQ